MNFGSTQNRNSKAEYQCEKQENKKVLDYYTFNSYGKNDKHFFFSIGSVPKSSREHLSLNSVDTESYLRNISSRPNLLCPKVLMRRQLLLRLFFHHCCLLHRLYTNNLQYQVKI